MTEEMTQLDGRAARKRLVRECAVFGVLAMVTIASAVFAKRYGDVAPALAAVDSSPAGVEARVPAALASEPALDFIAATLEVEDEGAADAVEAASRVGTWHDGEGVEYYTPEAGHVRYFNGRPIRPARTVWMVTTAYSPDHRSCGKWADGKTASLKSVWTNAMNSVAADTSVLPFGSLVSVPGYAEDDVVPVLDRGGAIKGARLDLLYPTHRIARQWGVQRLPVTIWEYADEEPSEEG